MTKKRFKLSMAALGLLAAFFMALIALLLAPTLASADKNSGAPHHQDGKPNVPQGGLGSTSGASIFADNWLGHDHGNGNAFDTPFCAKGVMPCSDAGDGQDNFGGGGGFSSGYGGGSSGGNHQDGGGSPKGDGLYASNFWSGGNGGGAGGGNGGGAGGGKHDGDHDGDKRGDKACTSPDTKTDGDKTNTDTDSNADGDNTKSCDSDTTILAFTLPGDPPSDFVDPSFGNDPTDGDNPKDGPNGDNPPITQLTDAPTEIPEPLTLSIFAAGLAGAAGLRRRSQSRRS